MQTISAAIAGVFGLAVGSFLNVVIHRVPLGMSVASPPSHCPSCERPIRARDNIPLVSWILLKGKCRDCGAAIAVRYPTVELLTALLFAGAFLRFPRVEEAAFVAVASAVLLALAVIDLDHRRVPNKIVLPSTLVAAIWVVVAAALTGTWAVAANALGSMVAGFTLLFLIAIISAGMGFGDVKLAAFIGVVAGKFGWETFVLALFSGFMFGGIVATGLLIARRSGRKDAIPFAPMLCLGALVGIYAGPGPVRAWLGL